MNEKKEIRKVSAVAITGNIILVIFKLYAGIVGKSSAMVSDAIHSLADVFATFVAVIGVKISRKAPDDQHPYGHDRMECVASLILGGILTVTGIAIGISGFKTVISGQYNTIERPTIIALIAAIVSIITKESMFWYTRYYAKKLNSAAFLADAWHQRSDALSSVGSLIGIAGSMIGYPILDSIACIIICICILKVGFDIIRDAIDKMLDTSCGIEFESNIHDFISKQHGVDSVDIVHSRKFGNRIYLDVEISVNGNLILKDAHQIAQNVHDAVEHEYPDIKHIMIHENPSK